jgi:predicted DNA-binding transcriptional regulator AlpA
MDRKPPLEEFPQLKILRLPGLMRHLGLSRGHIRRLRQLDPTFPQPLRLGIGAKCALGWHPGEIAEWIASRPRAVLPGDVERSAV